MILPTATINEAAMATIEFDRETREALSRLLVRHLKDSHDLELAPFDAADLLDFLSASLGPHFYNQGLRDAQTILQDRADTILEAIADLQKPAPY
jgi:uncharacterized protein (DUF2164 family)